MEFFHLGDPDDDAKDPRHLKHQPRRPPGTQFGALTRRANRALTKALDVFLMFFTMELMGEICNFTNMYAHVKVQGAPSYASQDGSWVDVTVDELYTYIAILLYMGIYPLPTLDRFWSQSALLSLPWPRSVMSRQRFQSIHACLHVVDPAQEDDADGRLKKLKYGTGKKKRLSYLVGNLVATNWPIEKALHAIGYNQIPTT